MKVGVRVVQKLAPALLMPQREAGYADRQLAGEYDDLFIKD